MTISGPPGKQGKRGSKGDSGDVGPMVSAKKVYRRYFPAIFLHECTARAQRAPRSRNSSYQHVPLAFSIFSTLWCTTLLSRGLFGHTLFLSLISTGPCGFAWKEWVPRKFPALMVPFFQSVTVLITAQICNFTKSLICILI